MRGPLAQHNLVSPTDGKVILRQKHRTKELKCREHSDENLSLYCVLCKTSVCCVCVQDGQHINHDAQPLGAMCKAQKVGTLMKRISVNFTFTKLLICLGGGRFFFLKTKR